MVWHLFKRQYIKNLSKAKPELVKRMKLGDCKLIFVAIALIGVLLFASPAIAGSIRVPGGEAFSELYLLGPDKIAQGYPSNVAVGQNYSVFVNVGNHLGSSAYYVLYIKLANATDQLANTTLGQPQVPLRPCMNTASL
jgi:uncharacterized membrane protein